MDDMSLAYYDRHETDLIKSKLKFEFDIKELGHVKKIRHEN